MSKLDRFLLSESFIVDWKIIGQIIGKTDISDHCPIWLKACNEDWCPKPFKFNNNWLKHPDFQLFIKKKWQSFKVKGLGDFVLKEKLRLLKISFRKWNVEVFGWLDLKVEAT